MYLSNVRAIPRALHGFAPPVDSSCIAVATFSINSFSNSIRLHTTRICLFKFVNIFLQIHGSHWTIVLFSFITFECPELLQSFWCTAIVLVKKIYKQSAVLLWDSHGELLRHEMKKSRVPGVFRTTEKSRTKIWDYCFFLSHTFSPVFNNIQFKFDVILISDSFFIVFWNFN